MLTVVCYCLAIFFTLFLTEDIVTETDHLTYTCKNQISTLHLGGIFFFCCSHLSAVEIKITKGDNNWPFDHLYLFQVIYYFHGP